MTHERILILDFGSQYAQLIARRVRELGVYCEIFPYDISPENIRAFKPKGIILSGGPETVTQETTPRAADIIFTLGCPVLGICYGMQLMAVQLGGKVEISHHKEFGHAKVDIQEDSLLFAEDFFSNSNKKYLDVWMSHGDKVTEIPPGFQCIAKSHNALMPVIAIMADEKRHFYGLQFHPEVTHTPEGQYILSRFVHDICGCASQWTINNIITDSIAQIQQQVGDRDKVVLGLSGGVDSSVVAALLHQAIGSQLICVFVDTGLLRLNESEEVLRIFAEHLGVQVLHIRAEQRFLEALKGVDDPEKKRKIIGREFVHIFEEQANKLSAVKWLAQGTIYPDVIESAGLSNNKSHVIKSHHNVGGLPETLKLQLLEPLRYLFKDEVRKLGTELGLPYAMVHRHPFPGPGLGVRILGEVKKEFVAILQRADAIFMQELQQHDFYYKTSQAFAVFLPIKSVGVVGDARCYEYVIALRAVETVDFMTARWAHLPYGLLEIVSNRIINEVPGISRVVYDISGKPPATIEWE